MDRLTEILDKLVDFAEQYKSLVDASLVDFITRDLWNANLPGELGEELLKLSDDEWYSLVEDVHKSDECQERTVPKFVKNCQNHMLESLGVLSDVSNGEFRNRKIQVEFQSHMNEKKKKEIYEMASLISQFSRKYGINNVIDIGSGKGYLSSFLSLKYGLDTLGIEAQINCSQSAIVRDQKVKKTWPISRGPSPGSFATKTHSIDQSTDVLSLWKQTIAVGIGNRERDHSDGVTGTSDEYILAGLHTCGDLSADSFDIFLANREIKILVNVGCCYHFINEKFEDDSSFEVGMESVKSRFGFPLSRHLQERRVTIGRKSRMLVSQSFHRTINNKSSMNPSLFRRSLLQVIIREKFPNFCTKGNVRIGKLSGKHLNFTDYVYRALEKVGLDSSKLTQLDIEKYQSSYADYRDKLNAFHRLRLLAAPVLEGLIILDRCCYLIEKQVADVSLTRIFNPIESPRCFAIIAIKK